jgi:transposase
MRKVREVLRLRHAHGVSERQIAMTTGLSRSTVGEYLRRAAVIGITWPIPDGLDDAELERRLFTPPTFDERPARPLPDWSHVHKELKRPAVTLLLLREEYRAEHSDGYGYSRFCELYRGWCKTISPTMRQTHGAAEKLFVDFAGDTVPIFDAWLKRCRRAGPAPAHRQLRSRRQNPRMRRRAPIFH